MITDAVRKNRYVIIPADFEKGYSNNVKKDENDFDFCASEPALTVFFLELSWRAFPDTFFSDHVVRRCVVAQTSK